MTQIKAVFPPRICDDCLQQVFQAADEDGLNFIARHCPHHDGLVLAEMREVNGERAIVQWHVQGPMPQAEGVRIATKWGKSFGAVMPALHDGEVH